VVQGNFVLSVKDEDTGKKTATDSSGRGHKPMMKKAATIMGKWRKWQKRWKRRKK